VMKKERSKVAGVVGGDDKQRVANKKMRWMDTDGMDADNI
jgi:hypothetical protein